MFKKYYKNFKRWMEYNPPSALTSKGWRLFNKEFLEVAPVRFYLTNNFERTFILPIKWKWEAISRWIQYRTYDKYHIVKTGLPPDYYPVDTLMLHANFNLLKEFVECELAWSAWCWAEHREPLTFIQTFIPFGKYFQEFRRPDLGIEHLVWESRLDDPSIPPHEQNPHQAVAAREKLELYRWWIERPNRKVIELGEYESQGLDMGSLDDDFDHGKADYVDYIKRFNESTAQEEVWETEDTDMLVRLIKVRNSLWT